MLWQLRVLYVDISPVKLSLEWTQFLKLHSQLSNGWHGHNIRASQSSSSAWAMIVCIVSESVVVLNVISFYQTLYIFIFFIEAERRIFIYTDKDWIFILHLWYEMLHQNRFFWNQWFETIIFCEILQKKYISHWQNVLVSQLLSYIN